MSFPAKYNGTCAADCGHRIHEGDEIERDDDGRFRHVDCFPKPAAHDLDRMGICRRCGQGITAKELLDGEDRCATNETRETK